MHCVNALLDPISLPRMVTVEQRFDEDRLSNVAAAMRGELQRPAITDTVRPGMRIAVAVGSRGIHDMQTVVREIVSFLKAAGAHPFVIPAMGSHGGASAQGQEAILAAYGITEALVGCPVRATMDVQKIGTLADGRPVLIDRYAAEADGIVVANRVKAHTAFRARYESGVMKMMAIGLGKQAGAEVCHRQGILQLGPNVEKFAFGVLQNANILFGVGIVENAFDHTTAVRAMTASEIPEEEPKLLAIAKERMARLLLDEVDVLVVDEIGKDISGEGMDPNIAGRWIVPTIQGGIRATRVAVLDLTAESLGNSVGLGMADVCSRQAADKVDADMTYPNSLTSTVPCLCAVPMTFDNHRYTIKAAVKMVPDKPAEDVTMIRIKNTLSMRSIEVSENLLDEIKKHPDMHVTGTPAALPFDAQGNLF